MLGGGAAGTGPAAGGADSRAGADGCPTVVEEGELSVSLWLPDEGGGAEPGGQNYADPALPRAGPPRSRVSPRQPNGPFKAGCLLVPVARPSGCGLFGAVRSCCRFSSFSVFSLHQNRSLGQVLFSPCLFFVAAGFCPLLFFLS